MKFKTLIVGALLIFTSAFAFADHHLPNLDGPGSLPPDAEPGQCFVHKFFPPKYKATQEEVLIKEAYYSYTYQPPVFETVIEQIETKEAYNDIVVGAPVFDTDIVKIQIKPDDPVWHVKCCNKSKGKCSGGKCPYPRHSDLGDDLYGKHDKHCGSCGSGHKKGPCEQACFKNVKPVYKAYKVQRTIENGTEFIYRVPPETRDQPVQKTVEDAKVTRTNHPAEYMTVKVYELVHPGYMKWIEGTCKKYTCNPRDLQSALKDRGYYNGSIDGIVGPNTISAMNSFREDNGLGIHNEIDEKTAKALGIKN